MDFDDDAVLQRETFTGQSLDLLLLGSSGGLNIVALLGRPIISGY